MTDTMHTPGPWGSINGGDIITTTGARVVVASIRGGFGTETQEANARLIAAAPATAAERDRLLVVNKELLAVLRDAEKQLGLVAVTMARDPSASVHRLLPRIHAAIAKAEELT